MAVTTLPIRKLLQRIAEGEIRIPAFQREFVWEPDRVQFLMDSIYKGYPIGTVLFWRTKEKLLYDRDLGPYTLPEPKVQYPIDYVLDGQQHLTSIFSVFQTEIEPNPSTTVKWIDIYFDLNAKPNAQDSQFVALERPDVKAHHVPLRVLFDVHAYGKFVRTFDDPADQAAIDLLQTRFREAQVPIETVETDEHSKIAIIFERVNRGGVPLDTYQLLSAWTWSGEFDLRAKFDELSNEIDGVGFSDLGDDPDLLLKCCAAVIKNDASAHAVIDLKGSEVRDGFVKLRHGLLGALDFLSRDCGVSSLKILPYRTMIVPLVRCFATDKSAGFHPDAAQRKALIRWFWQSCFSRRYSNSVDTALSQDISAIIHLLNDDVSLLIQRSGSISSEFFKENVFSLKAVNTKTFILLLARNKPKSFLSGADVNLEAVLMSCNRTEFHHIFPKNYLKEKLGIDNRDRQFMLANFAFLSQSDNRSIQDKAPRDYKGLMPASKRNEILNASFIPENGLDMDYQAFIDERAKLLAEQANLLMT